MISAQRIRVLVCVLLCLAGVAVPVHADDFLKGMQALELGHPEQAIELWRPLAESGSVEAQFGLGVIYNDAMGVEQDYLEANYWFLRAAEQGLPAAQYNLGNAYKNGTGMTPDPKMAVLWWRKAAEQDFGPAQFNLGSALLEGLGTLRNTDEALRWYRKAAANGHTQAQRYLDEMNAKSAAAAPQQAPAAAVAQRDSAVNAAEDKPAAAVDATPDADTRAETVPVAPEQPAATAASPAAAASQPATDSAGPTLADPDPAPSAAPADCGDWLDRDAHTHTLQLLSSPEPDDARQYAAHHALNDTAVCSYRVKGRRWHALLLGRYGSTAAARSALAGLPAQIRADGAYVRRIDEIRNAIAGP